MILSIARAIAEFKATFKHPIQLMLFCGEEQGLLGSKSLSKFYKDSKVKIQLMINADMIGYRKPGESIQFAFNIKSTDPEATNYARYVRDVLIKDGSPVFS